VNSNLDKDLIKKNTVILDKKGVSPAISWIILIGMAVTMAGVVTVWTRGLAEDSTDRVIGNVEKDLRCDDIVIHAYEATGPNCASVTIGNRGLFSISGYKIRDAGGIQDITLTSSLAPQTEKTESLSSSPISPGNTISIIPVTMVEKEEVPCLTKEVTVTCSV